MLHLIFVTLPPKSKITPIFTPCQKQNSSSNPNLWAPKLTSFRGTPCHIFYHRARWLKSPKLEVSFMQLASTALLVLLHWLVESSKYKNDVLSASRCFLFLRKSNPVKWCGAAQQSFQNKKGLPHTNLLHHIGQNRPSECTLGDMGCKQLWSSYTLARGMIYRVCWCLYLDYMSVATRGPAHACTQHESEVERKIPETQSPRVF